MHKTKPFRKNTKHNSTASDYILILFTDSILTMCSLSTKTWRKELPILPLSLNIHWTESFRNLSSQKTESPWWVMERMLRESLIWLRQIKTKHSYLTKFIDLKCLSRTFRRNNYLVRTTWSNRTLLVMPRQFSKTYVMIAI